MNVIRKYSLELRTSNRANYNSTCVVHLLLKLNTVVKELLLNSARYPFDSQDLFLTIILFLSRHIQSVAHITAEAEGIEEVGDKSGPVYRLFSEIETNVSLAFLHDELDFFWDSLNDNFVRTNNHVQIRRCDEILRAACESQRRERSDCDTHESKDDYEENSTEFQYHFEVRLYE